MPHTSRITVGMPVYKGVEQVGDALRSLQAQTYPHFEVWISVDGADQETADACLPFTKDPRFNLVVQDQRLDWAGNFNWLLSKADREFFCYRQHDDTTNPDFFEKLLKLADAEPTAAVVYTDCQWTGARDDIEIAQSIEGVPLSRLLRYVEVLTPTPVRGLIRREAIEQAGLVRVDEFRSRSEVFVWLAKLLRWGSFLRLPEPIYLRLSHDENYHKSFKGWSDSRLRASWTTMFTGLLEAISPLCQNREERIFVQHFIMDRIVVRRPGRAYLYWPNNEPMSSGKLILECLERLATEGNVRLFEPA